LGAGVINVGQVCGGREGVGAGGSTGSKGVVEIGEDFMEDEAGKEGAEGAALGNPSSWRKEDQVAVSVWNQQVLGGL
jgi:hypothetical protein